MRERLEGATEGRHGDVLPYDTTHDEMGSCVSCSFLFALSSHVQLTLFDRSFRFVNGFSIGWVKTILSVDALSARCSGHRMGLVTILGGWYRLVNGASNERTRVIAESRPPLWPQ